MHQATKLVLATTASAVVLVVGWSAFAQAAPSNLQTRLQQAEDERANCQLLANNTTSGTGQHNRAVNCVTDQTAIINLLNGQINPSPSTSPTGTPSASPSITASPSASVTPSNSPSPSSTGGGLLTNCFTQLAACGYPTIGTTGVPVGTILNPTTGDITVNFDNTVIDSVTVNGCVTVNAANVTIKNSRIICPGGTGIYTYDARGATLIQDTEISCVNGTATGLWGKHFVALRLYIHDCENALEINEGSTVRDSYLVAREATTAGHGDDIQSQDGNNITIKHNTFAGLNPITSSIISNPTLDNNWDIEDNFLSAGAYTVYCPEQGTGWLVKNNRFYPAGLYHEDGNGVPIPGTDLHSAGAGLTDACNHAGITWTGNYRDNDLSTVTNNS